MAGQQMLENRLSQMEKMQAERIPGYLPNNTINPRGKEPEQAKAITLKSGKTLPERTMDSTDQVPDNKLDTPDQSQDVEIQVPVAEEEVNLPSQQVQAPFS